MSEIEMSKNNLTFHREFEMPIHYDGYEVGKRRVDFLVEERIVVELKALLTLEDVHIVQTKNYLEAFKLELGLLINFGARCLEFKRIYNNKIKHLEQPV